MNPNEMILSRLKRDIDQQFEGFKQLDHNGQETMKLVAYPLVMDMCLLLIADEKQNG